MRITNTRHGGRTCLRLLVTALRPLLGDYRWCDLSTQMNSLLLALLSANAFAALSPFCPDFNASNRLRLLCLSEMLSSVC